MLVELKVIDLVGSRAVLMAALTADSRVVSMGVMKADMMDASWVGSKVASKGVMWVASWEARMAAPTAEC